MTGYGVTALGDIDAKWETSKMLNVGFDATVFDQRLGINFDWYLKKTSDMLIDANWSALAGNADKPKVNIGDMENKGVDLNLTWRDKVGEVDYSIGVNLSHYKEQIDRDRYGSRYLRRYSYLQHECHDEGVCGWYVPRLSGGWYLQERG